MIRNPKTLEGMRDAIVEWHAAGRPVRDAVVLSSDAYLDLVTRFLDLERKVNAK